MLWISIDPLLQQKQNQQHLSSLGNSDKTLILSYLLTKIIKRETAIVSLFR